MTTDVGTNIEKKVSMTEIRRRLAGGRRPKGHEA